MHDSIWTTLDDLTAFWRVRRWFRFKWQKLTRGWTDEETWNLDLEFAKWMLPRLKRYKELSNSHPSQLTPRKWRTIMYQMIHGLEIQLHAEDAYSLLRIGKLCKDEELYRQWKEVDNAYKLLGKYIRHLWS